MKIRIIIVCLIVVSVSAGQAGPERFERIKSDLAKAPALEIDFISVLESTVFETVDSFPGNAMICSDGRYFMEIGSDQFLFDGQFLYSYSPETNQVTVERLAEGSAAGDQVTFITRLNDHFDTEPGKADRTYRLIRKATGPESLPDSMMVVLDRAEKQIAEISFYDINEELNRILIDSILVKQECDTVRLVPAFPDSAETIRLY